MGVTDVPQNVTCAVVVGMGSAGGRHASMLRHLLPDAELVAVRRPASEPLARALEQLDLTVLTSLAAATERRPDIAVVAGPAPYHRAAAITLLESGAEVLVEKPLAATPADAAAIVRAAEATGRQLLVGYHLRFGGVLPALADAVRTGAVGDVTGFRFEVGQHLEQWRPGTDARASVSARRELGGGVLLELSHELDAVRAVVGPVAAVEAAHLMTGGSPTDGNVETEADLELTTTTGHRGQVHLDMTSATPFRRWTVTGSLGRVCADHLAGSVELHRADGSVEQLLQADGKERDRAEHTLIRHLIDLRTGSVEPRCTGSDGMAAVAVIEAARASAAVGSAQPVGSSSSTAGTP